MKKIKEWFSDYLRYFMLFLAAILIVLLILAGVRIYQNANAPKEVIEILTEKTGTLSSGKESEETESSKNTTAQSESVTEQGSENAAETESSSKTAAGFKKETVTSNTGGVRAGETTPDTNAAQTGAGTTQTNAAQTGAGTTQTNAAAQTDAGAETTQTTAQTMAQTEPVTEPVTETEYVPVYKTLQGTCYIRSYADYGDNIIGEYSAGTVVEFLEDVGGWYKVQIDGMVGYMGARFFN